MTIANMYLLIEIRHYVFIQQPHEDCIEVKKFDYMFEIDIEIAITLPKIWVSWRVIYETLYVQNSK